VIPSLVILIIMAQGIFASPHLLENLIFSWSPFLRLSYSDVSSGPGTAAVIGIVRPPKQLPRLFAAPLPVRRHYRSWHSRTGCNS